MDKEIQDYIDKKIEDLYLSLTEIVGSAMAHQAFCNKVNSKFYSDYPEFKDKKEVVASVVEKLDGENPGTEYDELLKKAIPHIKERIATTANMNVTSADPPKTRDFGNGEI